MSIIKGMARANVKLLQLVQQGYRLEGKNSEEIEMCLERMIHDHNRKHDKTWHFEDTRMFEVPRPGRYRELYSRELKRKQDRRTIAFLCKHVMAEKSVKIPMK